MGTLSESVGTPSPGVTTLSLRKFAELAQVSPATVSRVFSQPETVAEKTRLKVLELAESMGFRPSPIARAAVGGSTKSVGVVLPSLKVSFFADVLLGLQRRLLQDDYLPMTLSDEGEDSRVTLRRLVDHRMDALVMGCSDESLSYQEVYEIVDPDLPLILIDNVHPGFDCDAVLNDDYAGGRAAGRHLLELGHEIFGFIHYGEGTSNCEQRLDGFRCALREADIDLPEQHIVNMPPRAESMEKAHAILRQQLRKLFSDPRRPTAVFASNDRFALETYLACEELGLRIPGDLSVIGFADLEFAPFLNPPLTTIRQYGEDMGRRAAELILARLTVDGLPKRTEVIPVELVRRASTAPPRGTSSLSSIKIPKIEPAQAS